MFSASAGFLTAAIATDGPYDRGLPTVAFQRLRAENGLSPIPRRGNVSQQLVPTCSGRSIVLYLVEARASMEAGNAIDSRAGPGPMFAKIVERFHPQAIYTNPTRRQVFMVVDLDTPAQIAELMYILTWFASTEPTFTPIMR